MAGPGRYDDRRPPRDPRGPNRPPRGPNRGPQSPARDERGPERDPFAAPRDDGFTVLDGVEGQHEKLLVCDECGLSFLSPPYRAEDRCPTAGGEFPCRGRLRSMSV